MSYWICSSIPTFPRACLVTSSAAIQDYNTSYIYRPGGQTSMGLLGKYDFVALFGFTVLYLLDSCEGGFFHKEHNKWGYNKTKSLFFALIPFTHAAGNWMRCATLRWLFSEAKPLFGHDSKKTGCFFAQKNTTSWTASSTSQAISVLVVKNLVPE